MDAVQKLLIQEIEAKTGLPILLGERAMYIEFGLLAVGAGGCYQTQKPDREERIFWAPEVDPKKATHVLLHELAHASARHLNRPIMCGFYTIEYDREEVIAETVSTMLMYRFALDTEYSVEESKKYITRYSQLLDQVHREYAASQIQKAYSFILNNWLHDFEMKLKELRKAA